MSRDVTGDIAFVNFACIIFAMRAIFDTHVLFRNSEPLPKASRCRQSLRVWAAWNCAWSSICAWTSYHHDLWSNVASASPKRSVWLRWTTWPTSNRDIWNVENRAHFCDIVKLRVFSSISKCASLSAARDGNIRFMLVYRNGKYLNKSSSCWPVPYLIIENSVRDL